MRRVTQVLVLTLLFLVLIPATGASADEGCMTPITGKAFFDFGRTSAGMANVVYDGERMSVPFRAVDFQAHDDHFDIVFRWEFPQGPVTIVEHADNFIPIGGPVGTFNTSLEVIGGGSGGWDWSGTANRAGGVAVIKSLAGTLCVGSSS